MLFFFKFIFENEVCKSYSSCLFGFCGNIFDYYFFYPIHFSRALFFFKNVIEIFWILKFELVFSFVIGWKKKEFFTNSDFIIRKNPKISKNRVRYLIFSDYRIRTPPKHPFFMVLMQFGLRNPNYTSTNSKHVCNMDSHFKDNINLPNSHPCVFMIKTPLEGTSYGTPPLRIQNSIV